MNKEKLQALFNKSSAKCADLNAKINLALENESFDKDDFQSLVTDLKKEKIRRDGLNEQIQNFEDDDPEPTNLVPGKGTKINGSGIKNHLEKQKTAINTYIHSKGQKITDDASTSVTSTQIEPLIPEEIIYNPTAEIDSVTDLSTLVTKTPVTTAKGTYPILKRADDSFNTVEELAENPALASPDFKKVDWEIDTYRGAIPISEESIDDSEIDLTGLIGRNIGEKRVNTFNKVIAPILAGFTAKTTTYDTLVDDLKHILNKDLDPAYSRNIVATQSMYQVLDTLKDNEGQYILHRDITTGSGQTVLGIPLHIVSDDILGADGEAHAFVGDLKRAVLFTDRKEITLAWMKSEIYGQYLGAAMRFGVTVADENAGYYLTATAPKA